MTSENLFPTTSKSLQIVDNATIQSTLAYKTTRLMASILNATQMTLAEAYINGVEIPDSVFRSLMQASMPILFKHAPGLLAPYEWVLTESDRLAESSRELMKVQYDLPQAMLNQMLGDWPIIYPKYSMALWEDGAADLESAQMQMIDRVIERLEIVDGDRILDFGCGWARRRQASSVYRARRRQASSSPRPRTSERWRATGGIRTARRRCCTS